MLFRFCFCLFSSPGLRFVQLARRRALRSACLRPMAATLRALRGCCPLPGCLHLSPGAMWTLGRWATTSQGMGKQNDTWQSLGTTAAGAVTKSFVSAGPMAAAVGWHGAWWRLEVSLSFLDFVPVFSPRKKQAYNSWNRRCY